MTRGIVLVLNTSERDYIMYTRFGVNDSEATRFWPSKN